MNHEVFNSYFRWRNLIRIASHYMSLLVIQRVWGLSKDRNWAIRFEIKFQLTCSYYTLKLLEKNMRTWGKWLQEKWGPSVALLYITITIYVIYIHYNTLQHKHVCYIYLHPRKSTINAHLKDLCWLNSFSPNECSCTTLGMFPLVSFEATILSVNTRDMSINTRPSGHKCALLLQVSINISKSQNEQWAESASWRSRQCNRYILQFVCRSPPTFVLHFQHC